ncbi:hypothetical protein PUG81_24470 [Erwiniaceae bacterium L1_54_6]|nr:hypothetical protein [Erwiniaceae bacterium L1_54_6]
MSLFRKPWLAMSALNVLFLPLLLSSCGTTRTEYVQAQPVPLPANLLIDCIIPEIPYQMSWGDSLTLNEQLLAVVEKCNQDKAAIRNIEQSRQEQAK